MNIAGVSFGGDGNNGGTGNPNTDYKGFGGWLKFFFFSGFKTKSLLDWLQMLIVPVGLTIGFNMIILNSEDRRAKDMIDSDDRRAASAMESEDIRSMNEMALEDSRAKSQRWGAYVDRMAEMIMEERLRVDSTNTEVGIVARTRTLSALRDLNGDRKGPLIRFLYESGLIGSNQLPAVIDLTGADLTQANLRESYLVGASLSYVNLRNADLRSANLEMVELPSASITNSDLTNAVLNNANLTEADLHSTTLIGTSLIEATLIGADMRNTNLGGATLNGANLQFASLQGADLREASLDNADLRNANLEDAQVTEEQLASALSLRGAILPNGDMLISDAFGKAQ